MIRLSLLWPLFFLTVIVVSQEFGVVTSQQPPDFWKCSLSNHTECECFSSTSTRFTLQCYIDKVEKENPFVATYSIDKGNSSLVIDCPCHVNSPLSDSVYSYLEGIPFKNISILQFNFCPLPGIDFSTFFGEQLNLSSVQKLTIQSCVPVSTLPPESFHNLFQLLYLNLQNNYLEYLPDDIFQNQTNLKFLGLTKNKLGNITGRIFKNQHVLKSLQLGSNHIKNLDSEAFSNLTNLIQLNLQRNYIETLPSNLFHSMANLSILDLSNNNLTSLENNTFHFNSKLTVLFLRNNFFTTFPPGLFVNQTHLRDLNLAHNQLTKISSDWFISLRELASLDISSNQITSIEENTFKTLRLLETLKLDGNLLVRFEPNVFYGLVSLTSLSLQNNTLEYIEPEVMEPLDNLTDINLAGNRLTFNEGLVSPYDGWQQSPLRNNLKLKTINLSRNQIGSFFSDFTNMLSLTKLDLSSNLLSNLHTNDLSVLPTNKDFLLDLKNNKIKYVDFESLTPTNKIDDRHISRKLFLNGNPLVCDCRTFFLAQYMNRSSNDKGFWDIYAPTCREPASLTGMAPTSVNPSQFVCPCQSYNLPTCDCYGRPSDKTLVLDCQRRNLTKVPARMPIKPGYQVELNLAGNQIDFKKLNLDSLDCCGDVSTLDLSYNQIDTSMFDAQSWTQHIQFPKLSRLDLSHNNISSVPSAIIDTWSNSSNLTFLLSDNPWSCDCSNLPLLTFVQTSWRWVEDSNRIRCRNQVLFNTLSVDKLCPTNPSLTYLYIAMPLLALLTSAFGILIYRSRRTILAWLYNRRLCLYCVVKEDEEDADEYLYDAFVSFSHLDEEFVIQELVPQLERPPSGLPDYRLCLHYRDW